MEMMEDQTSTYVDADWDAPAPGGGRRTGNHSGAVRALAAALIVVVVAALVYSGWEMTSQRNKLDSLQADASLRASALKAAAQYGVYLSSYDYSDLTGPTAPWTEVDRHATASFRKDFDSTRSSLKTLIDDYKATAAGTVVQSAISSVSPTRASALLFIDQKITNTAQKPGTTVQPLRVVLVMTRQNGRWLIDQLQVPS